GEAAWNGNNLKGLAKTGIFLINFKKGNHTLYFLADQNPILESIALFKSDDKEEMDYSPEENNPAQDGDRRQWMAIVLANLPVKNINIKAIAKNYQKDDDDIKLIIDGNIQKNETEKSHENWFWCGRILNRQEKEFNQELNLAKGLHYIEFWADRAPEIKNIKILIKEEESGYEKRDTAWWINWKKIKKYIYKGILNNENYNRYDDLIINAVACWNEEFFSEIYYPNEPLDPSLIKAIIFQESRVGYDKNNNGNINVMQVGNTGDPSLDVLNGKGEKPEYELRDGKLREVDYNGEAKVEKVYDSINWGVRWLYHRAQWIGDDKKRHWFSWKDAVKRYGPGMEEYADNVWSIYTQGVDNRNNPPFKLWIIIFIILIPALLFSLYDFSGRSIKSAIFDTMNPYERAYAKDIKIEYYNENNFLFLAIIEWENDWSEDFKAGIYKDSAIEWLQMENPPTEQSILEARFVFPEGFSNPIIEIYGKTHAGHGAVYFYEVKNNQLNLLLKTQAVDFNNDIRWASDNYEKYGYGNCGEVFSGGKLFSSFEDLNNDGMSDIVLSGTKEIICEKEISESSGNLKTAEIKVASISVKKIFLWNESKKSFLEQ
ncbi:hypothetical protein KJ575_04535, partial [Patescibacteria group bacterium]|nr:hypothetical protein [Patescibacteria group bacterium]